MAYATETRTGVLSVGQRINEFRATLEDRLAKYKMYRATMLELNTLSDRDLADLGISRAMIKDIAATAAYGK